jgi:hypothetical protein
MASVEDVPDDLKSLARVIPPLTRSTMTDVELRLRCEFAAQLIGLAALSDDGEARQLRRKARQHLEALSVHSLGEQTEHYKELAREAALNNGERAADSWLEEASDLVRRNPQLPEDWLRDVQLAELVRSVNKSAANRPR